MATLCPLSPNCSELAAAQSSMLQRFRQASRATLVSTFLEAPLEVHHPTRGAEGYARSLADGRYAPERDALVDLPFMSLRENALRQQRALVRRLVAFAQSEGEPISNEEAEQALLAYLGATGPALASVVRADSLPVYVVLDRRMAIIHAFVATIVDADPEGFFAALDTFVKGAVLHGAVFLPNLGRVNSRFQQLDIYLDTRLLLRALGFAGPIHERPAGELLECASNWGHHFSASTTLPPR